jgi:hypothetical protein
MPKSLQLNIPTPCLEDWQNMTPNDKGRHCLACQKTVIDFTSMNDREILDYIAKSNNSICGRVNPDQMERPINFPSTGPQLPRKYFWRLFVPAFLLAGKVNAQKGKIKVDTIKVVTTEYHTMGVMAFPIDYKENNISGLVYDSKTKEPIDGVNVTIVGSKKGTMAENGSFNFARTKNNKDMVLEFSAIGYKKTQLSLYKREDWVNLKIYMDPEPVELAAVTVQGWPAYKMLSGLSGAMVTCYKIKKTEKIIRSIVDTLSLTAFRAVKAYPNPVVRGNSINLELAIKETGDYKLELMDEIGRVVWVQPLQINATKQTNQVATNSAWTKGIYWLRITGPKTKSIYQAKILLQ